jgi:hypothetical protein
MFKKNHCIFWPKVVTNENLWKLATAIKRRKWKWTGHTLRKDQSATERQALGWKPQGQRRRGRARTTWGRTVEEEARKAGKIWRDVKGLAGNRVRWR